MSSIARKALSILARRVLADPTADADARKLAAGWLMLTEGKLPK
jgi:hypothetical protein